MPGTFLEFAKAIHETMPEQGGEILAFLVGEAGVAPIRTRIGQIDLGVRDIEIAAFPCSHGREMADYDLIVIGSGPAGHHAAIQGAKLGRRVAIVERQQWVGGVCINTGTIPSKTLREAVLYLSGVHQRGFYGVSYRVKPHVTMPDLMFRCHHVIEREVDVYRAQFARNGVDVLQGEAAFEDPSRRALRAEIAGPVLRSLVECGVFGEVPDA